MGRTSTTASRLLPPSPGRWGLSLSPLLATLLLAGCANDRPRPLHPSEDLFDPNPGRRVQAVSEVRRMRETEHLPALVEMLDDEDETVRLVAAATLQDLTGHAEPARAYGTPAERRQAVEAWRAWLAQHPEARPAPSSATPAAGRGRGS